MRPWLAAAVAGLLLLAFPGVGAAQANPSISINDVDVDEGDRGTNNARFTVTLSDSPDEAVTVQVSTANDTATAGQDYTAQTSRTLTFDAGDRTESFTVEILSDTIDESDERFFVNLTNATNATISDNQGIGTINDDDGPGATPSPSPTPSPTGSPQASPSPTLTPSPSPSPTRSPTPAPAASPPTGGGLAQTGGGPAGAGALAALMLVVGWMLRRSAGEES